MAPLFTGLRLGLVGVLRLLVLLVSGFRCYINGNITTHNGEATRSISGSFRNVNYHNIGRYAGNSSDPSSAFFGGYMSDLRMYIGAYKYWDAFTPY
jgi:hypothetical protein